MDFLSKLIFLRILGGLKPSNFILGLGFVYLGFLVFSGGIFIFEVIYIAVVILVIYMLIIGSRVPTLKERQRSWSKDPDIVAHRKAARKSAKAKEQQNPYE